MIREKDQFDPKGLIRESYRIEGISAGECRTIFLDWALGLPEGVEQRVALTDLLSRYGAVDPDHPMSGILAEGLHAIAQPKRRGGWKSRPRN